MLTWLLEFLIRKRVGRRLHLALAQVSLAKASGKVGSQLRERGIAHGAQLRLPRARGPDGPPYARQEVKGLHAVFTRPKHGGEATIPRALKSSGLGTPRNSPQRLQRRQRPTLDTESELGSRADAGPILGSLLFRCWFADGFCHDFTRARQRDGFGLQLGAGLEAGNAAATENSACGTHPPERTDPVQSG